MEELPIIVGVLIILCIVMICDCRSSKYHCNEHMQHYNKMHYQLPKLTTLDDGSKDLNSQTSDNTTRKTATSDTSKPIETMWHSKPSHGKASRSDAFDDKAVAHHMKKGFIVDDSKDKTLSAWNSVADN